MTNSRITRAISENTVPIMDKDEMLSWFVIVRKTLLAIVMPWYIIWCYNVSLLMMVQTMANILVTSILVMLFGYL